MKPANRTESPRPRRAASRSSERRCGPSPMITSFAAGRRSRTFSIAPSATSTLLYFRRRPRCTIVGSAKRSSPRFRYLPWSSPQRTTSTRSGSIPRATISSFVLGLITMKRQFRWTSGTNRSMSTTYDAIAGFVSRKAVVPKRCGMTGTTGTDVKSGMKNGSLLMSSITTSYAWCFMCRDAKTGSVKFASNQWPRRSTRIPSIVSSLAQPGQPAAMSVTPCPQRARCERISWRCTSAPPASGFLISRQFTASTRIVRPPRTGPASVPTQSFRAIVPTTTVV